MQLNDEETHKLYQQILLLVVNYNERLSDIIEAATGALVAATSSTIRVCKALGIPDDEVVQSLRDAINDLKVNEDLGSKYSDLMAPVIERHLKNRNLN